MDDIDKIFNKIEEWIDFVRDIKKKAKEKKEEAEEKKEEIESNIPEYIEKAEPYINLIILILIFIVIDIFLILISLLWLRLNIRKNYKLLLWVIILNIVFIILLFFPDELQNYIEKKKKEIIKFIKYLFCRHLLKIVIAFVIGTLFIFKFMELLGKLHERSGKILKKYIFRFMLFIYLLYFSCFFFIIYSTSFIKGDECKDISFKEGVL
jgi:hypothetical protein